MPRVKVRSDEDAALIQIESKSPKEFAKKIREWMGKLGEKSAPSITTRKAILDRETSRLSAYTERGVAVADALRPNFYLLNPFFFFV